MTMPYAGLYTLLVEGTVSNSQALAYSFSMRSASTQSANGATTQGFDGGGLPYYLQNNSGPAATIDVRWWSHR